MSVSRVAAVTAAVLLLAGCAPSAATPAPADDPSSAPTETETSMTEVDPAVLAAADAAVGMEEDAAIAFLEGQGYTVRVTERDGEFYPMTMDYRMDRVNIAVKGGVVFQAHVG